MSWTLSINYGKFSWRSLRSKFSSEHVRSFALLIEKLSVLNDFIAITTDTWPRCILRDHWTRAERVRISLAPLVPFYIGGSVVAADWPQGCCRNATLSVPLQSAVRISCVREIAAGQVANAGRRGRELSTPTNFSATHLSTGMQFVVHTGYIAVCLNCCFVSERFVVTARNRRHGLVKQSGIALTLRCN